MAERKWYYKSVLKDTAKIYNATAHDFERM